MTIDHQVFSRLINVETVIVFQELIDRFLELSCYIGNGLAARRVEVDIAYCDHEVTYQPGQPFQAFRVDGGIRDKILAVGGGRHGAS